MKAVAAVTWDCGAVGLGRTSVIVIVKRRLGGVGVMGRVVSFSGFVGRGFLGLVSGVFLLERLGFFSESSFVGTVVTRTGDVCCVGKRDSYGV